MYRWKPAYHPPLQLLPRAYLLLRRPEFINAALSYARPSVLHSSERPGTEAGKTRQAVASCLLASR